MKNCIGSNTDGEGFLQAIRTEFSIDLRDLRVIIIGAGGGNRARHSLAMRAGKL